MALQLNGTSGITFNNSSTQSVGGVGSSTQSWQDVTASRSAGTTYTNSSGMPIFISIKGAASGSTVPVVSINSIENIWTAVTAGGGQNFGLTFIVENGDTYNLSTNGGVVSVSKWIELR